MVKHADIDHTGITGVGGDISSHTGDATDAHDASAISVLDTAANFTGTDVEAVLAELQDNIDAGGGGGASLPDQSIVYPTSLTGNDEDGTSVANWADVAAFTTKSVVDSKFAYFMRSGGAGLSRVRKTLGTTRAGAFDFRFGVAASGSFWSSSADTYWLIELRTSADALIGVVRIEHILSSGIYLNGIRVGGSGGPVAGGTNINRHSWHGQRVTLRITRDGSDVLRFYTASGDVPMVLPQVLSGSIAPYTVTSAGTVARIEIACNTINVAQSELWLDYFDDAS